MVLKKLLLSWQARFPLPLPPEPERELVQVTDVKTRKHLQCGATSSLQYCLRQAGILAGPLLLMWKMLSGDRDIHAKPSLFSSCCEWCWPSTSTPTVCALHLRPITMPDYPYKKFLSSNIKLQDNQKPVYLLFPMCNLFFLYLPIETALIHPSTLPIMPSGMSVLMQAGELRSLEPQKDPWCKAESQVPLGGNSLQREPKSFN